MRNGLLLAAALGATTVASPLVAQADLSDTGMAHVAVTASRIDIAYAHLALAISENEDVRRFAETMIQDHTAANEQVAALARRLDVQAEDNDVSRKLLRDAEAKRDELSRLRGEAFDRAYARNELAYHRAVNAVLADAFVPNADHPEVRKAFESALLIFRGHERHAEQLVSMVSGRR